MTRTIRTPSSRVARAVLSALLVAVAVGGCGSDHEPKQRPRTPPPPAPYGLAVLTCPGQGSPIVRFIDPGSGRTIRTIATADGASGPGGAMTAAAACPTAGDPTDGLQVMHTRQQFSPDFARQAVTTSQLRDGTTHVGYLDLTTRRFTDISAASSRHAGFTDRPTDDSTPVFSSDGSQLVFVRDQRDIDAYDVAEHRVTLLARLPRDADPAAQDVPFVVAANNQPVQALPNPSGTGAVIADDSAAALGHARLRVIRARADLKTLRFAADTPIGGDRRPPRPVDVRPEPLAERPHADLQRRARRQHPAPIASRTRAERPDHRDDSTAAAEQRPRPLQPGSRARRAQPRLPLPARRHHDAVPRRACATARSSASYARSTAGSPPSTSSTSA